MTPTHPARLFDAHELPAASPLRYVYRLEQVIAASAIVFLAPVAAAIAIVIAVLSRRCPLVRHWRVGQQGSPLGVLKFRTMWDGTGSPSSFFRIEDLAPNSAVAAKQARDVRVTSKFAALCRRYSLDELPQLIHVMRGEMSLVGPRPLTATELCEWYGSDAREILSLRPGLTGLWQVEGRNRLTYPQRRRLDLFLARKASVPLYFAILLRTVPKVLAAEDAY